ncbi:ABC transporter substrate-binding protein [Microlunatus sp. GCM10028923]|uniref:ABC transporter substrate-binding protein n=1 Tax=Microlunatus sp. GCM10028923 TaxID=3273400 RepID=UPI003608BE66
MSRRPNVSFLPRRSVLGIGAGLGLGAAVAGCTAGSTSTPGGPATRTLTVGFVAEPANLDFTRTDGAAIPQALLVNVYEGLVKLDQNGAIVPLLAKSWKVSDDRLNYTFELVDNARFTNGRPFTADDVIFSIDRVTKEWTTSLKAKMDVVAETTKIGEHSVQVTLKQPSNSWLYSMATRVGAMFSTTGVDDLANQPYGTGPFRFVEWKRGDSITLEANPDYWGAKPGVDRVVLRYFKDATALNNALLSGGIDVISAVVAPESLGQFGDTARFQVIEGTSTGEVVLSLNNGRPPFDDVRVRRAVRHAINHQELLDTAWAGRGQLIGGMVPPSDPWYEDLTGLYPYDPAKAKALLAEAGAEKLTVKFRIANLPYATAAAQVVKSQLQQVGITANIEPLEFPARWLDQVFTKADYDLSIVNHVEPRDITAVFGNPKYYPRYDNAEVRKLFAEADAGTEDEQVATMKQAAKIISEDAAADFLFLFPNLMVATTAVKGLPQNVVSESFDLTGLSKT